MRTAVARYWAIPLIRRLFVGAAWSVVGSGFSRLLALASSVVIARLLGVENFGQLVILQSSLGMFGVFAGLGLGVVATKFAAELKARDPIRLGQILSLIQRTAIIGGLLISVALALSSNAIATKLEILRIEEFIYSSLGFLGRPPKDRSAIARAFVAKMIYNLPTTRALLDRLSTDQSLRRICGWERINDVPDESVFSRAFAEFSASQLPERVHAAFIEKSYANEIVGHIHFSLAGDGFRSIRPDLICCNFCQSLF